MTTTEEPGPDPVIDLIGLAVAGYFSDVTGRSEPEAGDLDLAFSVHEALSAAGFGDLRALAASFVDKADTHDRIADRWAKEDREQALIDSGIAAGYRGAAELILKPLGARITGPAAVLALHTPVRRYKASFLDDLTFPTAERALLRNRRDPMRGFESIVLTGLGEVPFIEICGECSRVENSFDQGPDGYPDDHDDEHDGTELSTKASSWPCATYTALAGA